MSVLNDISIDINGGDAKSRAVVGGLIQSTLSSNGFTEVTTSSETEVEVESMLDAAREASPELFATPIFVNMGEIADPASDAEEDEVAE
jgi:hypothetical protein